MSKSSLALIAALGAGGGAALTAAAFSLRPADKKQSAPLPSDFPSALSPASSASLPSPFSSSSPNSTERSPVNPAGFFDYGFPGPIADLAVRSALVSAYDRRTRNPHYVIEHITPASLALKSGDRRHSHFLEDDALPPKFRARLSDYARSGYDRGHQVPAADARWSQLATDETFFLTNMCPQVGDGFNRDYWAHLEDFCRRLTRRYPSVRIATGPLYLPKKDPADGKWYVKYEVIGTPPAVAVPTHFYKVVFAEDGKEGGEVAVGAFVLPNARIDNAKPLVDFEVPLEAVERASGLEFGAKLAPERRRRLCADNACSLVIRDYAERQKAFGKGSSSNKAA